MKKLQNTVLAIENIAKKNPNGFTVDHNLNPITQGYSVATKYTQNSFGLTGLAHVVAIALFQNLEKLLAPNGMLITIVPFIYKFHYSGENFGDYWRYTPHSIDLLHKKSNLFTNLIEVGPDKGYEKYLISIASRENKIPKIYFDKESFSNWNHNLGDNSLNLLLSYLTNRIFDSIKMRKNHAK